jgi:hypothetical protein
MKTLTERDVIMVYKIVCKLMHQKYVRPTAQQVEAAIKAFAKLPEEK